MAQYKKRKPVPKTQSQLTREQIEAYDSTRGTAPASSKQNRENQISLKGDKTKLPIVSFKDIDSAIFYYFQNVIKPTVIQNGVQIDVPVMYGNPERWSAVQKGSRPPDDTVLPRREHVRKTGLYASIVRPWLFLPYP